MLNVLEDQYNNIVNVNFTQINRDIKFLYCPKL